MAVNVREIFQPALRSNRHSLLSVIRKQGILTVASHYKRTTEHLGAEGSTQMKETDHGREDSNRNKLVIAGKLCRYKPIWFCMAAGTRTSFVDISSACTVQSCSFDVP